MGDPEKFAPATLKRFQEIVQEHRGYAEGKVFFAHGGVRAVSCGTRAPRRAAESVWCHDCRAPDGLPLRDLEGRPADAPEQAICDRHRWEVCNK